MRDAPTQADFDRVAGRATALKIRRVGIWPDYVLYESDDPVALTELHAALRIVEVREALHCLCPGDVEFVFSRFGEESGRVTLHHFDSLRLYPFFANVPLAAPDALRQWLRDRGMPNVEEESEDERRAAEASMARIERKLAAIPDPLYGLWSSVGDYDAWAPEADAILRREYPQARERARILFTWYGQGEEAWTDPDDWDRVPEWCLLQIPLEHLVAATRSEPQSEALLEGATRFFARHTFVAAGDIVLPDDVKRRLLDHSRSSGISDGA